VHEVTTPVTVTRPPGPSRPGQPQARPAPQNAKRADRLAGAHAGDAAYPKMPQNVP